MRWKYEKRMNEQSKINAKTVFMHNIAHKVDFILRKLEFEVLIKAMPIMMIRKKRLNRHFYTSNTVRLIKINESNRKRQKANLRRLQLKVNQQNNEWVTKNEWNLSCLFIEIHHKLRTNCERSTAPHKVIEHVSRSLNWRFGYCYRFVYREIQSVDCVVILKIEADT